MDQTMTKDQLELEQVRATIANLNAETAKLQRETRWPPVVVAALLVALIGPALLTLTASILN